MPILSLLHVYTYSTYIYVPAKPNVPHVTYLVCNYSLMYIVSDYVATRSS